MQEYEFLGYCYKCDSTTLIVMDKDEKIAICGSCGSTIRGKKRIRFSRKLELVYHGARKKEWEALLRRKQR